VAGVILSLVGAFEATPDGTAWLGRKLRPLRVMLARWLPFLRKSATVHGVTATAALVVTAGFAATAEVWKPNATTREQVKLLRQMLRDMDRRVAAMQQEALKGDEAVRAELRQAVDELRAASREITIQIKADKDQAARADARGIWVVVAGIVLTAFPAGLATWAPLGIAAIIAGYGWAAWVGYLISRDDRRR